MRDLRSIAHEGVLSNDRPLRSRAHMGWLTSIAIVLERAKGWIFYDDVDALNAKKQINQEEEVLLIIKIFLKLWNS